MAVVDINNTSILVGQELKKYGFEFDGIYYRYKKLKIPLNLIYERVKSIFHIESLKHLGDLEFTLGACRNGDWCFMGMCKNVHHILEWNSYMSPTDFRYLMDPNIDFVIRTGTQNIVALHAKRIDDSIGYQIMEGIKNDRAGT